MHEMDIEEFFGELSVKSMDFVTNYEYNGDVIQISLKHPHNIQIQTIHGFMCFEYDAIDYITKKDIICFIKKDTPILKTNLNDILGYKTVFV